MVAFFLCCRPVRGWWLKKREEVYQLQDRWEERQGISGGQTVGCLWIGWRLCREVDWGGILVCSFWVPVLWICCMSNDWEKNG